MRRNPTPYARRVRWLKAMAHPGRLKLLAELSRGPCCVGGLQKCLSLSQPHVSQSLKQLKAAGIVAGRREKTKICYRIVDPRAKAVLRILLPKETSR